MSDSLAVLKDQSLPAAPERKSSAASGFAGGDYARISIRGFKFRPIINGTELKPHNEDFLDIVIIDWADAVGRQYYEGSYDAATSDAPVCFSDNGETPHASSKGKQSNACKGCPQNAENSSDTGRGRACGFVRRIAVMVVGMPDRMFTVDLKALTMFNDKHDEGYCYKDYVKLLEQHGRDPMQLVTRMHMVDGDVPTLKFSAVEAVGAHADDAQAMWEKLQPDREETLSLAITQSAAPTDEAKKESGAEAKPKPKAEPKKEPKKEKPKAQSGFGAAADDENEGTKPNISESPEDRNPPAEDETSDDVDPDDPLAGLDPEVRKQIEELNAS